MTSLGKARKTYVLIHHMAKDLLDDEAAARLASSATPNSAVSNVHILVHILVILPLLIVFVLGAIIAVLRDRLLVLALFLLSLGERGPPPTGPLMHHLSNAALRQLVVANCYGSS